MLTSAQKTAAHLLLVETQFSDFHQRFKEALRSPSSDWTSRGSGGGPHPPYRAPAGRTEQRRRLWGSRTYSPPPSPTGGPGRPPTPSGGPETVLEHGRRVVVKTGGDTEANGTDDLQLYKWWFTKWWCSPGRNPPQRSQKSHLSA